MLRSLGNPAGQIGVQVTQGQSVSLLVVGNRVQPGTFHEVSGNAGEITVFPGALLIGNSPEGCQ